MRILDEMASYVSDMRDWRRDIHAHPETAFEERRTSDLVADKLTAFGLDVHKGLGKTGVVGTLRTGPGPAIGLRADMDALFIDERNTFSHVSQNPGRMHACGHDGHTAMLLGAARHLAETRAFRGTVHFIFQPAEENEGGGRLMVEEGLFEKFPMDMVFALHNWPGRRAGSFAVKPGVMMASSDNFEITLTGKGAHGAMPHLGTDPIVAGAAIVGALQTIASRETDPLDSTVVSVTCFNSGETWNAIPAQARLKGTARALSPESRDALEEAIGRIARSVGTAHGVDVDCVYHRLYPPTVNNAEAAAIAARAAARIAGEAGVDLDPRASMGGEDFSFMLQQKTGCYIWLGNGPGTGGCTLHNAHYDFNDDILATGAAYWCALVDEILGGA
ncbi:M20 aminoacylase family protein [Varunaivibrio sulfuroxidans]|uniref:Hippurate hydrolase n=1 Tax=Varunaivibrio sulfuroxidans TaxID=1773489 RepID=A0A4R3JE34_9PROT|nr:M20 aminoacylase family protein [Varunaivibrio sulfuroxidans]TCS64044.1 hippurate hydrolase [Varunaivibrio sulfuroxidans]WES31505.1 M20 family metallopeptidase [Varunaivibrio sulfuroxidans]